MMTIFAFCGVILLLVTSPALLSWRCEWRRRKLAEARLSLSECVTRMQSLLAAGKVRSGEVCHDEVFQLMLTVQTMDQFPFRIWKRFGHDLEGQKFRDQLIKEMLQGDAEVRKILGRFVWAYNRALRYRHPLKIRAMVACLYLRLLLLGATWISLLAALNAAVKGRNAVSWLKRAFHRSRSKVQQEIVILGYEDCVAEAKSSSDLMLEEMRAAV